MKNGINFLLIVLLMTTSNLMGQSGAVSPYSYFGIGTNEAFNTSRYLAMGQTGIALGSELYLNSRNPASLTSVPVSTFLYDIGIQGSVNTSKSRFDKQTRYDGGLSNISIGFRLSERLALSAGMEPVSQAKYMISLNLPVEGTSTDYPVVVEGEGGITRTYLSTGFRFNENLSIGGTVNYFFGSVDQTQTVSVNSETITNFIYSKKDRYTGIGFGLGMQYEHDFDSDTKLTFGGILNFKSKLGRNTAILTEILLADDVEPDFEVENENGNVFLPFEAGFGMAMYFGRKWQLTADYASKKWNKSASLQTSEIYKSESIFSLGAEFNPRGLSYQDFFKRLSYRFGASYSTGNFKILNENVDKVSASLGVGIPVSKSGVGLNFSYVYTKRGWISNSYLKDTYHLFSLSFSGFENWFVKKVIY